MIAEHCHGCDPFQETEKGGEIPHLDTPSRLLEALAGLNLDPAEVPPVEVQIILAARLGLTQQELHEARTELRRRMAEDAAPALMGGGQRLAQRGARSIPMRIEHPRRLALPTPDVEAFTSAYPADLYASADPHGIQPRVYQVIRANGVDLRYPVAQGTVQAIAFALEVDTEQVTRAINRMRPLLGIQTHKGAARFTPIVTVPDVPETAAPESFTDQVRAVVTERGIDLQYLVPEGFVPELMARFHKSENAVRSALKSIRRQTGIHTIGRPAPGGPRAVPAAVSGDARALALEIAAELRRVEGPERSAALLQAGRLLEKMLG